jgi:N-acetylglucosaminyl-diphospho-decaprenol L-rhamnosyltransferase
MPSISVVTIVRNRLAHLTNVLRGLETSTRSADQVVVVVMGGEDPGPHLPTSANADLVYMNSEELPLAAARNVGAQRAVGELLVFLDVDCIPGSRLIEAYSEVMQSAPSLCMGQVR